MGKIAEVKVTRSPPSAEPSWRPTTFARLIRTTPIPMWNKRSGQWPWRTKRDRPSARRSSLVSAKNDSASVSTASARRRRAPSRRTDVSGSSIASGCRNAEMVVSVVTGVSLLWRFGLASTTAPIRRPSPSCHHPNSAIARAARSNALSRLRVEICCLRFYRISETSIPSSSPISCHARSDVRVGACRRFAIAR